MKLIDLLVKKTFEEGWRWPDDALSIAQDGCGICWGYGCEHLSLSVGGRTWRSRSGSDIIAESSFPTPELAEDWNASFVIRSQYEAALAKNDGWIEWGGGECPVPEDSPIEVKYRDGTVKLGGLAGEYIWTNGYAGCPTTGADIIAYRPHRDINTRANDDRLDQDLNECIGQDVAPAWNGDGLPPVGTICVALMPDLDNTLWRWRTVKVVESGAPGAEKEVLAYDIENTRPAWVDEFRPLRTEAEKARDEAIQSMASVIDYRNGCSSNPLAGWLYEAIAAGKIPGIKLESK